ncbi:MAG: Leucine-, isoleucine-, valine-, threonine-, and alanine-binding protein precursor [Syntrophus sp. PtaU1.Bin208]|nr:MAG: Leucine-, isoleucine-, valine-, threonine-, and alanine-binding protein precursor [Syntrophus sp. PtaU1.Bin208]
MKVKAKFPLSVFLFLAALCLFLTGCSDRVEPIRIGVIAELTGDMSAVGVSCRKAAQMAADEINEGGGLLINNKRHPVELIVEDNGSRQDLSEKAALNLIRKHQVVAIVGPNASRYVLPAAAVAEKHETLLISPWSTSPWSTLDEKTGKPKKFVFRAGFIDSFQGSVLAEFILETLLQKKAAVLYESGKSVLAHFFREAFEKGGGKVVAFETYKIGDTDLADQLGKIRAARPEIVFLPNYYWEIPLQIHLAKKIGITAPFIGSDSWGKYELLEKCGYDCESFYFSGHYALDASTVAAKKFINNYQARYNRIPDDVAALTYDAFGLLWQGLKIAETADRIKLRNAMAKIPQYEGVTGTLQFREGSGDPIKSVVILQIKDGQFVWIMNVNP